MKGKPFFDRMYGRALAWRWMLSRSKGHFGFELGLAASGLLDIARFFVFPRNHPMPIVYVSGVVHIRTSLGEFRFFTRRATDDVYSSLPSGRFLSPAGAEGVASSLRMSNTPALSAPAAPLDDICQDLSTIRLIKIDVEGAERELLLAAREVLTKTENLVVEVSGRTD